MNHGLRTRVRGRLVFLRSRFLEYVTELATGPLSIFKIRPAATDGWATPNARPEDREPTTARVRRPASEPRTCRDLPRRVSVQLLRCATDRRTVSVRLRARVGAVPNNDSTESTGLPTYSERSTAEYRGPTVRARAWGHGRSNTLRGDSEHAPDLSERVPTPLERSPGHADAMRPLCERPSVTLRTCDGRSAAIGVGAPNADWSRCNQKPSLLRTPIGEGRTRDRDCRTQIGQSRTPRLSLEAL